MKLEFAFLADAATMLPNGTFDVIAGGFDVVRGKRFPATKHTMVLIGRLRLEPEECGKDHEFAGEIFSEKGESIFPAIQGTFSTDPYSKTAKRANWVSLCLNWQGVSFPAPGDYFIRVLIDGKQVGEVILEAVQRRSKHDAGGLS